MIQVYVIFDYDGEKRNMEKWFVTTKKADFNAIAAQFHISPIAARILRNRDLITEEAISLFLNGTLSELHSPHAMKDMDKAVAMIASAIARKDKVRIIGDYDIDGICASYILLTGLQRCDADADVRLPDRVRDGYGINEAMIEQARQDGIQLLVTCDNGIAAYDEIRYAKEAGMDVVITDHHEVPYDMTETGERVYRLPPADAVVDPHRADCTYPYAGICGAVVAYKVIEALCGQQHAADATKGLLEFAAMATVGDVMELLDENRIIVKYGLERMKTTENIGLRALIDVVQIEREKLSPFHIGYVLGPCINATGRLDTAERALSLFTTKSKAEAVQIAGELKSLNDSRKDMTKHYQAEAVAQVEKMPQPDKVLVIYLPECHESLAGIIAGRIREKYYRPTFILTRTTDGIKGSGRSIEAYHMYEEMSKCKELFSKYGGHRMAAGLSMREEDIDTLRKRLNGQTMLTEEDMQEKVQIDVPMPITYATKELVQELSILEPFGAGNPKPLFAEKNVSVHAVRVFGKNRNVVKLSLENEAGVKAEGIWFGDGEELIQNMKAVYGEAADRIMAGKEEPIRMSIAYYPTLNIYMGKESIQLNIQHYLFVK